MMVGDNINDTAAFSESSFSVYVGSDGGNGGGTDATLLSPIAGASHHRVFTKGDEACGPVVNDSIDLEKLRCVILLARRAVGKIRQNKLLGLVYNILALTLASGVLQSISHRLVLSPYVYA